jgi:hypothetical protein
MTLNKKIYSISLAVLGFGTALPGTARDLCNRDDMGSHTKACLNVSAPSDYQKGGIDDLIKGRFCGKGDLARDGMFRCLGENQDAIKTILGCSAPAVLEVAVSVIPENDPRKPTSCN